MFIAKQVVFIVEMLVCGQIEGLFYCSWNSRKKISNGLPQKFHISMCRNYIIDGMTFAINLTATTAKFLQTVVWRPDWVKCTKSPNVATNCQTEFGRIVDKIERGINYLPAYLATHYVTWLVRACSRFLVFALQLSAICLIMLRFHCNRPVCFQNSIVQFAIYGLIDNESPQILVLGLDQFSVM